MTRLLPLLLVVTACAGTPHPTTSPGDAPASPADAPGTWLLPTGWRSEIIAFPLDFAPSVSHHGLEELRFPPAVFDPQASTYWSYAFAWRLDDAAALDPSALAGELTAYFRGLMVAVDAADTAHPEVITASVDDAWQLDVHLLDGFNHGAPVDLTGSARRVACGNGALWLFELYRPTARHDDLDQVTAAARCGQTPVTGS
jgi:hypothetical protein